jgi:hypothetical protein
MTIPYTYRVFNKITSEYYYGVRFAKNCKPSDLFVSYFTSSKSVKNLIELHGREAFTIEIRKIFNTKEDAVSWERRVNKWTMKWSNYLNKHSNGNFILTNDERHLIGVKSGNKCRDLKLGFHAMSAPDKSAASSKGAETNRKNQTGIYSISIEQRIATGNKCRDLKLGFHSAEGRERQRESAVAPWWNDGTITVRSKDSPGIGWQRGRIRWSKTWWNNGIDEINIGKKPAGSWKKGKLKDD